MIERPLLAFINHLLDGEEWARARLQPFAGRYARFEIGPLALTMIVGCDGSLRAGGANQEGDVCVRLPDDAPLRLITDPGSLFAGARLTGPADFAETLGFVFRNLRWDPEADLAKLTGDVVARRTVMAATSFATSRKDMASRFSANLVEYAADEAAWILRPAALAGFSADIQSLADDLSRLEARVARLD